MERAGICVTCDWSKGCVLNDCQNVLHCAEFSSRDGKKKSSVPVSRVMNPATTEAE